jgi:LytS/YehU family sensor histidine kinase
MPGLDPLKYNRATLFWVLQIGGWTAYAISQLVGAMVYDNMPGYHKAVLVAAIWGFVLTIGLRYICRWLWRQSPRVLLGLGVLSCYVIALCWRAVTTNAYRYFVEPEWEMKSILDMFAGSITSTYLFVSWAGIYFGIKYYESLQQQREATLRAATLAQEAQLKMLRYQLNPHFLFNTLNAISTLILDNHNRIANQMVMRLSEFLRYTLDQDPMKKVTLRQEIEAMNLYLTTEKLRFGDRLKLEYAVEEGAMDALVPSLLLQPLIENAVKFAVSPSEIGGTIRVEGRTRGSMLELAVADDGPGLTANASSSAVPAAGRGVGLRNTRERLAVLYEEKHRFATIDNKPGLRIELGLPLELAAE